jgi:hypothetical protein
MEVNTTRTPWDTAPSLPIPDTISTINFEMTIKHTTPGESNLTERAITKINLTIWDREKCEEGGRG